MSIIHPHEDYWTKQRVKEAVEGQGLGGVNLEKMPENTSNDLGKSAVGNALSSETYQIPELKNTPNAEKRIE